MCPQAPRTTNDGLAGISRATCAAPSARSTRASTSIALPASPSMAIVLPSRPPGCRMRQRATWLPPPNTPRGSPMVTASSGIRTCSASLWFSPRAGTFQSTS
jgi:hypothetical protein